MSVVLDDALSQYLEYNGDVASDAGDTRTLSAWVKSDDATAAQGVVSIDDDSTDVFALILRGATANDPVGAGLHQGSNDWAIAETSIGYSTGSWQHVVAVFHSITDRRAFINGGNKGTNTTSLSGGSVDKTKIGAYGSKTGTYFSGKIAEVAIWGTNLSDTQVAQLTAGALPTAIESSNLKGWWKLEDDYLDSSGNGKTMVGYNSPTFDSDDHPTVGAGASFTDKTFSKKYIAVANNEVWYESAADTMSELAAANGTIDTNKPLTVVEAFEKVFFANGINLKVADFGNTKITTDDIGSNPPDNANVLTGQSSGAEMVVDYITALSSACTVYGKRITTATFANGETVTGKDDDGNDISFVLSAAETAPPHWYDWTVYGNDSSYGVMPEQANKVFRYQGRVGLVADKNYPHQWYLPRQNNPWDWNYVSEDAQSPVAGEDAEAGQAGDIIITAIPYSNDYLIFACANSLQYVVGNPAEGGTMLDLDSKAGILGMWGFCWDNKDNLYLLTTTGLQRIPRGFGALENLTETSYPDFIDDLAYDSSLHRITLEYDRKQHGIIITKTTLEDGTNSNWWYDLRTEGLFPESYADSGCGVFSMFHYEAVDPDYNTLLFGCNDGYIRFSDPDSKSDIKSDDTSEAIDSYITFGPLKLGGENEEGEINSIVGILTGGRSGGSQADSDDVTYKVWTGLSADEVAEKLSANTSPLVAGTIKAPGRWRGSYKRQIVRGMFAGIRLGNNTADETWGFERLLVS